MVEGDGTEFKDAYGPYSTTIFMVLTVPLNRMVQKTSFR